MMITARWLFYSRRNPVADHQCTNVSECCEKSRGLFEARLLRVVRSVTTLVSVTAAVYGSDCCCEVYHQGKLHALFSLRFMQSDHGNVVWRRFFILNFKNSHPLDYPLAHHFLCLH